MASASDNQEETTEEEFRKNPELKKSDLDKLREWVDTQKHLPDISEKMLILFHHSCHFDLTQTKDTIENYYTMRTNAPEFFTNRDITSPDLVQATQTGNVAILPVPVADGYRIIYGRLRDTDPNNFIPEDIVKLLYMTVDAILVKCGTTPGFHCIFDMEGSKLKHLTRTSISTFRKFVVYSEKATPFRRIDVHLVHVPSWIDKLVMLVKPWMSKHSVEHLHLHTDNLETLYKHFSKECLPKELGGNLASLEEYHAANCLNLESFREYFTQEEKLRVDESKRETKSNTEDEELGRGTFRRLDID